LDQVFDPIDKHHNSGSVSDPANVILKLFFADVSFPSLAFRITKRDKAMQTDVLGDTVTDKKRSRNDGFFDLSRDSVELQKTIEDRVMIL
jgi:hypothetical protein